MFSIYILLMKTLNKNEIFYLVQMLLLICFLGIADDDFVKI